MSEFVVVDIPGLLQTDAYMQAQFVASYKRSPEEMGRDIEVRRIRQHRLTSAERPLEFVAVVHETALHRELGGRQVMHRQLLHLATMADLRSDAPDSSA